MKVVIYSLAVLVLVPALFLALMSITARAPKTGLVADRLRACPDTPNCVVSENAGPSSRIEPLRFTGAPEQAWAALRQAVARGGGVIREDRKDYLWATFTSRIFRFVDDVEFRLDAAQGVIHLRSASRAGSSDFGVNRKRVERLRIAFADALK